MTDPNHATPAPGAGGKPPSEAITRLVKAADADRLAVSLAALQTAVELVLLTQILETENLGAGDKPLQHAGERQLLRDAFATLKADAWDTINAVRALNRDAA